MKRQRHTSGGSAYLSLIRVLSKHGIASRTRSEELIRNGSVRVNRRVIREPHFCVDLRRDRVEFLGERLRPARGIYLAMHKPAGVVTTRSDERGRRTVYDLLPKTHRWVFPIGRLDKDSSGLLLLTNDTKFGSLITDPESRVSKTYIVTLDRPLHKVDHDQLETPMILRDGTRLLPAKVTLVSETPEAIRMRIVEGKNRQIRRMCTDLGYSVLDLVRHEIGPIRLGTLESGKTRPLTPQEIETIVGEE